MTNKNTNKRQLEGDTPQSPDIEPNAPNAVQPAPAENSGSDSDSTGSQENNEVGDDTTNTPDVESNTNELVTNTVTEVEDTVNEIMPGVQTVADAIKMQDVTLTLNEVSAPTKLGEESIHQMESLDMSKLIGAPINAAVEAHYNAAKKMLGCINDIGVKDGTVAMVTFSFFKNGKVAKMAIPLLTLVPITAMRIKEMTYDFKIKFTADTSINLTTGAESTFSYGAAIQDPSKKKTGENNTTDPNTAKPKQTGDTTGVANNSSGAETPSAPAAQKPSSTAVADAVKNSVRAEPTFGASFSSKKDSKATQDSKYSVESSMDIGITVVSDENLPGGISKMLQILNDAISVYNPKGELTVSSSLVQLADGYAVVKATYLDGDGNSAPDKITCKYEGTEKVAPQAKVLNTGDGVQILFNAPGPYMVTAEKLKSAVIVQKEVTK